jgi:hypothetical protein
MEGLLSLAGKLTEDCPEISLLVAFPMGKLPGGGGGLYIILLPEGAIKLQGKLQFTGPRLQLQRAEAERLLVCRTVLRFG